MRPARLSLAGHMHKIVPTIKCEGKDKKRKKNSLIRYNETTAI